MPTAADLVQHVVVLMLENRSFDHMLGYIKSEIPLVNGLNGTAWNPDERPGAELGSFFCGLFCSHWLSGRSNYIEAANTSAFLCLQGADTGTGQH